MQQIIVHLRRLLSSLAPQRTSAQRKGHIQRKVRPIYDAPARHSTKCLDLLSRFDQ